MADQLKPGDRVMYLGVEVDIYGTLEDIQDGVGVVLWDNGVVRDDVVLKNLRKA